VAAIANANHEVKNHFSAPPFQYLELKQQGVHKVIDSREIIGGPLTQATFFTTTQFAEANPKLVNALRTATEEAIAFIKKDPKSALEAYKSVSGDKTSIDDLMAMLKEPHMDEWRTDPQGTMKFAEHLHKVGTLKTMPKAWTDYYLPDSTYLNGN
jgi:NitT/TauT family transport system substrate-binding protein